MRRLSWTILPGNARPDAATHRSNGKRRCFPDTPNNFDLPNVSAGCSLFASYVDVLRCWTCGWRGYQRPWPSQCGKCGSWVSLDRAPAEPLPIPNKRIRLL